MANFTLNEANAWLASTKLSLSSLDNNLAPQIAIQVKSRLASTFNVTEWTADTNTPELIRSIMAMLYVAAVYERTYTDDNQDTSNYADILRATAELNIVGLLNGTLVLAEDPTANSSVDQPAFFPNDLSSITEPTVDSPSDGGPAFLMGTVW